MEDLAPPVSLQDRRRRRSRPGGGRPDPRALVVEVVAEHAESLLRVARRYTSCPADAEDAYQRALEIFVRNAGRLDPATAHKWLHTVVKHEALAVRAQGAKLVGVEEETALDALDDGRHLASVEERSERFDDLTRAAEALQRLKPQEVTALWLKAEGLSYAEIAARQGWTYTKVNRCITEGRKSLLRRLAGIEAGGECERWASVLSAMADGEASAAQIAEARPHLRNCAACRATLGSMHRAGKAVAGLLPPAGLGGLALDGATEPAVGLVARWHELTLGVHERAAAAALKVQAAAEAITSGKAAAVGASVAAIAGGGVAVHERPGDDGSARASSKRAAPVRSLPAPTSPALNRPAASIAPSPKPDRRSGRRARTRPGSATSTPAGAPSPGPSPFGSAAGAPPSPDVSASPASPPRSPSPSSAGATTGGTPSPRPSGDAGRAGAEFGIE